MDKVSERLTLHWKDVCNLILGIWLAISPWVLTYAMPETPAATAGTPAATPATAAWNAHIVGIVVAVAAIATLVAFHKWEEWVNAALGLWLIVSPYLLGFAAISNALWNQIVVGVLIGGLAIWAAVTTTEGGLTTGT